MDFLDKLSGQKTCGTVWQGPKKKAVIQRAANLSHTIKAFAGYSLWSKIISAETLFREMFSFQQRAWDCMMIYNMPLSLSHLPNIRNCLPVKSGDLLGSALNFGD